MTRWALRRRRKPVDGLKVGPGVIVPVGAPSGLARVGEALRGISADLAALDWDWHPNREPRPTKLLIRDQERENAAYGRWLDRKHGVVLRRGGPY